MVKKKKADAFCHRRILGGRDRLQFEVLSGLQRARIKFFVSFALGFMDYPLAKLRLQACGEG